MKSVRSISLRQGRGIHRRTQNMTKYAKFITTSTFFSNCVMFSFSLETLGHIGVEG